MDDEGYEPPVGNMKDWDKNREWYDGYKKAFIDFQDPALGDCPLFPLYKIITKKVFRMIDYFSSFAPGWPRAAGAALTLLNIWCSSCVGPVNEWCKAATANILPRASVTAHDTSVWRRASNEGYPKVPEYFTITEKAPTRAFSWLKVPTTFLSRGLLRDCEILGNLRITFVWSSTRFHV